MRKTLIVLLFGVIGYHFATAQYCGNSGSWQCTPNGLLTQPGFDPPSDQTPPFVNGQPANTTIQYLNFSVISIGQVDTVTIDSIVGLPNGLCWSSNKSTNGYAPGENGCIHIAGTPTDTPGQYKLRIYLYMSINGGFIQGPIEGELLGLNYFLRLKNVGDSDNPVDTNQTVDFIPYGGSCNCNPPLAIGGALLSPDTICEGDAIIVHISANTQITDPTNYYFLTGSDPSNITNVIQLTDTIQSTDTGTIVFHLSPFVTGLLSNSGPIEVRLAASSQTGPPVTLSNSFYILDGAYLAPHDDTIIVCLGDQVSLDAGYVATQTYLWTNTVTNAALGLTNLFTTTPSTSISLGIETTLSSSGCTQRDTVYLQVFAKPNVLITDSVFNICYGDSVVLHVDGPYWFYWMNLHQLGPSSIAVSPSYNTIYGLQSIDPLSGCNVFDYYSVSLKETPYQGICMVTVDSNSTHNIVIWEKVDKEATDSFFLYKETTTGNYQQIAALHRDSLSEYHDYSSNPNLTGYRYKIALVDTCGAGGTSFSEYHNTIHLQYLGNGNLQWNEYAIEFNNTPVLSYDIYLDALNSDNWQLLASVSGNQTTVSDPNFAQHPNARYRVQANWSFVCSPSRNNYQPVLSNIINQQASSLPVLLESSVWLVNNDPERLIIETSGVNLLETRVYTNTGALATRVQGTNMVNTTNLARGTYVVHIVTNQGTIAKRWIKW